jgi:hypothetical protein
MRSIDDVPVLSLTFSSKSPHYSGYELRRVAAEVADELKKDKQHQRKISFTALAFFYYIIVIKAPT